MSDRDDAALRQFKTRSQQPRVSGPPKNVSHGQPVANVNVFVSVYDHSHSIADEIEATRFRYSGTSPQVSNMNTSTNRRLLHKSIASTYE